MRKDKKNGGAPKMEFLDLLFEFLGWEQLKDDYKLIVEAMGGYPSE